MDQNQTQAQPAIQWIYQYGNYRARLGNLIILNVVYGKGQYTPMIQTVSGTTHSKNIYADPVEAQAECIRLARQALAQAAKALEPATPAAAE